MDPEERDEFFADQVDGLPAGRPATSEDFGDTTVGVLSSRYLTGQVLVLDGGAALRSG